MLKFESRNNFETVTHNYEKTDTTILINRIFIECAAKRNCGFEMENK